MKFFILFFIYFLLTHSLILNAATVNKVTAKTSTTLTTKNNVPIKKPNKKSKKIEKKKILPFVGPPPPPTEDIAEVLYPDELGNRVSQAVVGLANRIDSFFGTARSDDEKNGSTLRIVPSYIMFEHKKAIAELGVNLNLKLINLENKAKKIEKAIRDEFVDSSKENKEKSGTSKTKQPVLTEEDWHYNFESKLASRTAIYYSGKLRARKNFTGDIFLHHFAFSAGWDTDDQWSQITSLASDKAINDSFLFRFTNDVNWYISEKLFQTTHGPSLINTINKYNFVSYNFRLIFQNADKKVEHINTVYSINYRHGTPSQRIFIDLIPSYSYPKEDYFSEVKSFEIRFEYFFGDL